MNVQQPRQTGQPNSRDSYLGQDIKEDRPKIALIPVVFNGIFQNIWRDSARNFIYNVGAGRTNFWCINPVPRRLKGE